MGLPSPFCKVMRSHNRQTFVGYHMNATYLRIEVKISKYPSVPKVFHRQLHTKEGSVAKCGAKKVFYMVKNHSGFARLRRNVPGGYRGKGLQLVGRPVLVRCHGSHDNRSIATRLFSIACNSSHHH